MHDIEEETHDGSKSARVKCKTEDPEHGDPGGFPHPETEGESPE